MGSVIALRAMSLSLGLAVGVFVPFISVILASRGFGPGEIGLVASLGALGFTIAVPMWGHLADVRLGRTRTLQVCAIGAGVAVLALLRDSPMLVIVLLFLLYWVFSSAWQPLSDAIAVNALRPRGGSYERIRLLTSLTFAIGTVAAGFLYDRTGYDASYVLLAAGAAAIALTAIRVPDAGRADLAAHRARSTAPTRTWRLGSVGVALRVAPRLGLVLLVVGLLHVGIISGFTFLSLRLVELGGSPSVVALSAGISAFAEVPSMLVAGWIAVRIGLRGLFVVGALLYGVAFASWAVVDSPALILASRVLTGFSFASVLVATVLTIAALLPADLQATGQALFQTTAFGIAAIVANVLGGLLYGTAGYAALFGLCAVLAMAAAIGGWLVLPRRPGVRPTPSVRQS
jgi:MFS transporter, PPP family, 3-phenylpropionic acid transporter